MVKKLVFFLLTHHLNLSIQKLLGFFESNILSVILTFSIHIYKVWTFNNDILYSYDFPFE